MLAVQPNIKPLKHFLLLLLLTLSQLANAQFFVLPKGQLRDALTFKLIKNLIVVPVYLNGKGPYNFILDSGISSNVITDTALLDTLKPKALKKMQLLGYGDGALIDAQVTNLVSVSIGAAHSQTTPTIFLKQDIFDLSGYLGLEVAGLIGHPFFKDMVVQINYTTKRLIFGEKSNRIKLKGHRIPITIIDKKPYVSTITTIGKTTFKSQFVIDCGASHGVSLERLEGKAWPVPSQNITANLGVGLNGNVDGKIARIEAFKIGPFQFNNPLASFPILSKQLWDLLPEDRNGNLGADILRRFTITFDYQDNAIFLKKNIGFYDPFEHDMAGLEIYAQGENFFISRVEPNSPAANADLKNGDQLMAVNFKPISAYTLDQLIVLFKKSDGNNCLIQINRNGETLVKLVRLKKRI